MGCNDLAEPGPRDLTSNLELSDDARAAIVDAVIQATAGIPDGAEVMLMGHSQGGVVAAALAGHRALDRLVVRGVFIAGSPVGFEIPAGTKVL